MKGLQFKQKCGKTLKISPYDVRPVYCRYNQPIYRQQLVLISTSSSRIFKKNVGSATIALALLTIKLQLYRMLQNEFKLLKMKLF